jgi:hypothetical protein
MSSYGSTPAPPAAIYSCDYELATSGEQPTLVAVGFVLMFAAAVVAVSIMRWLSVEMPRRFSLVVLAAAWRSVLVVVVVFHPINNWACLGLQVRRILPFALLALLEFLLLAPLTSTAARHMRGVPLSCAGCLIATVPFIFWGIADALGFPPENLFDGSIMWLLAAVDVVATVMLWTRTVYATADAAAQDALAAEGDAVGRDPTSSNGKVVVEMAVPAQVTVRAPLSAAGEAFRTLHLGPDGSESMLVDARNASTCSGWHVCDAIMFVIYTGLPIGAVAMMRAPPYHEEPTIESVFGGLFAVGLLTSILGPVVTYAARADVKEMADVARLMAEQRERLDFPVGVYGEAYHTYTTTRTDSEGNTTTETHEEVTYSTSEAIATECHDGTATALDPLVVALETVEIEFLAAMTRAADVDAAVEAATERVRADVQGRDESHRVYEGQQSNLGNLPNDMLMVGRVTDLPWTHSPSAIRGALGCLLAVVIACVRPCAVGNRARIMIRKHITLPQPAMYPPQQNEPPQHEQQHVAQPHAPPQQPQHGQQQPQHGQQQPADPPLAQQHVEQPQRYGQQQQAQSGQSPQPPPQQPHYSSQHPQQQQQQQQPAPHYGQAQGYGHAPPPE